MVDELKNKAIKGRQRPAYAIGMEPHLLLRYSSMDLAPSLPAPMARITVAAPVTASP